MEFGIHCSIHTSSGWYITFDNTDYLDSIIVRILNISIEEYVQLLKSFGAYLKRHEYTFDKEEDALKCAKYLNDNYLVLMKLQGII